MPIFELTEDLIFPPVEFSNDDGILAVGGDLSVERLILAYSNGIFPWYNEDDPIIWWSPEPRFILFPDEVKISKSMKKILKDKKFSITIDKDFPAVIAGCQSPRKYQQETWITDEMLQAYINLHNAGYAHSVEAWLDNNLVGGLYGVSLGKCFFGESMFTKVSNASKVAFITLAKILQKLNFHIIDSQVHTNHLESLGAKFIPRTEYISIVKKSISNDKTIVGNWSNLIKE